VYRNTRADPSVTRKDKRSMSSHLPIGLRREILKQNRSAELSYLEFAQDVCVPKTRIIGSTMLLLCSDHRQNATEENTVHQSWGGVEIDWANGALNS
jgi:hypothetical protein